MKSVYKTVELTEDNGISALYELARLEQIQDVRGEGTEG